MNITTSDPIRLPSSPPWRLVTLGLTHTPRSPLPHISTSVSVSRKVSRSHRDWRRALAVPTEGGCRAACANLQTFRDNATEIALAMAAILSRNLHIRFPCVKLSLILNPIFSTSIKKRKRHSYNILTIIGENSARTRLKENSTENCKDSTPAGDREITPLAVETPSLLSPLSQARLAPFRLEQHPAISWGSRPRSRSGAT